MSLQIAVAHTGQRLDADPVGFSSIEALKLWIARATQIPPEYQILLTPQGKHVKLQALLTEVYLLFTMGLQLANEPLERDLCLQSRTFERSAERCGNHTLT